MSNIDQLVNQKLSEKKADKSQKEKDTRPKFIVFLERETKDNFDKMCEILGAKKIEMGSAMLTNAINEAVEVLKKKGKWDEAPAAPATPATPPATPGKPA